MRIAVCVKQVPFGDANMDFNTGMLIRLADKSILNPYDRYAVEAALQTREKTGGTITALSMGSPSAVKSLREVLAVGVDEAILLTDSRFAGADTLATSFTLSSAINKFGMFDIIFCGSRTTDGDTAQVGPETAALLGLPFCMWATAIDIDKKEQGHLIVRHRISEGQLTSLLPMPCLIGVGPEFGTPRLPSIRSKLLAERAEIRIHNADIFPKEDAEFFGLNGSPTQVLRLFKISYDQRRGNVRELNPKEAATEIKGILK